MANHQPATVRRRHPQPGPTASHIGDIGLHDFVSSPVPSHICSACPVRAFFFVIGPLITFSRCPYSSYSYNVLNRLPSCMCDHKFVITAFLQYYCLPGYNLTTVSGKVTTVTPELFQAVLVLFVEETRFSLTFSRCQGWTSIASTQGVGAASREKLTLPCRKAQVGHNHSFK
jgi:hypothetical protein